MRGHCHTFVYVHKDFVDLIIIYTVFEKFFYKNGFTAPLCPKQQLYNSLDIKKIY